MKPSNLWLYRALRGGVWERTRSYGWYRMKTLTGSQPPNTENFEDHRDAHPLIVVCLASIVGVSVCAILALGG